MCMQQKAPKKIVTEEDLLESNIAGRGDQIGVITNRITAMYTKRSLFPVGSREYEELSRRMQEGQHCQQQCIDKTKGALTKEMPKKYYDRKSILNSDMSEEEKKFQLSVVADKKSHFMIYIYPNLNREYTKYVTNANKKALMLFRKDVDELKEIPPEERSYEIQEFLANYDLYNPVIDGDCTMNRIRKKIEDRFDSYIAKHKDDNSFDYEILKSGVEYSGKQYSEIKKIFEEYRNELKNHSKLSDRKRFRGYEASDRLIILREDFLQRCVEICPNSEAMCDIILDLTYKTNTTKKFAWDMCGDQIIENLLKKHDYKINVPVLDKDGDIEFKGRYYRMEQVDYYQNEEMYS